MKLIISLLSLSLLFSGVSCNPPAENGTELQAELILDTKSSLGEGSVWNYKTGELYWVDIDEGIFHIFNPETNKNRSINAHQKIGTVVPDKHGNAIVALHDGIYHLDLTTEELILIAKAEYDTNRFRYNDGKCDPAGRFWVGSMAIDGSRETAALYALETDGTLVKKLDGITISNGIVWSSDNKKMYYIDTPTQQVKEYDYDMKTGDISFVRVAIEIPIDMGYPDGMSIDADDKLWIAHWAGFGVYRWDPETGELMQKVEVPVRNVTSCAFGGKDLTTLYITTAKVHTAPEILEEYPNSGGVFVVETGIKGTPAYFYGE